MGPVRDFPSAFERRAMQSKRVYEKLRGLITCDEKANGNCRINLNHVTPFGVLEVRPKRASPSLAGCCPYRIPSAGAWLLQTATMNPGIAPGLFYLKADLDLKAVTIAIFKSCAVHVSPQAHLGNKDGRNPPFHFGRKFNFSEAMQCSNGRSPRVHAMRIFILLPNGSIHS